MQSLDSLPTRLFAGVVVPDTPLVRATLSYVRAHLTDMAYNHVVRSWLFGFAIASKVPGLRARDVEAHSVGALMHDLGWDVTGALVSADKRFEVDGADAARAFIRREAPHWDDRRLQLVWDAIALHTTPSIALHKEVEVVATDLGIMADFVGPEGGMLGGALTWDEWRTVVTEVPRLGMREGVREIMCGLCRNKPESTWDNFVGDFGERYVEGYSLEGRKVIDVMESGVMEMLDGMDGTGTSKL